MAPSRGSAQGFRWRLAEDDCGQPSLFSDEELFDRHVGTGEFRGLEFLHVNAKQIINPVPPQSRMGFRYTINAYRGCSHACAYCMWGDTPILMVDGRTRLLRDISVGDRVVGTVRVGRYRRYVATDVLAHWATSKEAYRVELEDGTQLITSADHRFLSNRGWKHVTGCERGPRQRPFLTTHNSLLGPGPCPEPPKHDDHYRRGYLTGMIRGDGTLGSYKYASGEVHAFRLALADTEALERSQAFLRDLGIETGRRRFSEATLKRRAVDAISTARRDDVDAIRHLIAWPTVPSASWRKGYLAGLFDAEGSYLKGVLRIFNSDPMILGRLVEALNFFNFPHHVEVASARSTRLVRVVRLTGGLSTHVRFFLTVDPAITRKRTFEGQAVKNSPPRRIVSVTNLGLEMPMFDITTGTGDFIAHGVISHNCFARPTHDYLGLGIGEDFERKLVVKVNAVEKVKAELRSPKWEGDLVAMGTNTDPYQRAEGKYHLTRGIVEALGAARNPFSILTKGTLILRDVDVLAKAAERTDVRCAFSIGTLDETVWRATEPGTPHPRRRVEAVRRLNEAGIPTGVLVAPILPGLSDRPEQLEEVTEACIDAGATSITPIALHLRPGVKEHFLGFLDGYDPALAARLRARYGTRSYLPTKDQDAITAPVRAVLRRRR